MGGLIAHRRSVAFVRSLHNEVGSLEPSAIQLRDRDMGIIGILPSHGSEFAEFADLQVLEIVHAFLFNEMSEEQLEMKGSLE